MVTKDNFVSKSFSNYEHQNLSIALFLIALFFYSSNIFMENVNPVDLFIFLFSYSQFASVKDSVSLNPNNEFPS